MWKGLVVLCRVWKLGSLRRLLETWVYWRNAGSSSLRLHPQILPFPTTVHRLTAKFHPPRPSPCPTPQLRARRKSLKARFTLRSTAANHQSGWRWRQSPAGMERSRRDPQRQRCPTLRSPAFPSTAWRWCLREDRLQTRQVLRVLCFFSQLLDHQSEL